MKEDEVNKGLWCPDCDCATILIDSIAIYRIRSYGMAYQCPKCFSYVGCHNGTTNALGRVANAKLRKAKEEAHQYFDSLWKRKKMNRKEAYFWLAGKLNIPIEQAHIGMFTVEQCEATIDYSKELLTPAGSSSETVRQ